MYLGANWTTWENESSNILGCAEKGAPSKSLVHSLGCQEARGWQSLGCTEGQGDQSSRGHLDIRDNGGGEADGGDGGGGGQGPHGVDGLLLVVGGEGRGEVAPALHQVGGGDGAVGGHAGGVTGQAFIPIIILVTRALVKVKF